MSPGPHLKSIPCYFNSSPLIHFICQVSTISVIYHSWIISCILSNPLCTYTYIWTCISSQQSYPNKFWSSKSNQATKHRPVSPNPSLRPKGLAQARRSRSGGSPSPRRGSKEEPRANTGSRLGESLLAWARCSLAQKGERVAWATFRAKGFGRVPVCLT